MRYIAKTLSGNLIDLGMPYTTTINKAKRVPADDLTVVLPTLKKFEELVSIEVLDDENKVFFSGIIDEQKTTCTKSGCFLSLISRSYAAYLLDNEALPQTYVNPSLDVIFNKHIRPYGFSDITGDKSTFYKSFTVYKGMSEWEVLESFCLSFLKVYPRVDSKFTVDATGKSSDVVWKFSNKGGGFNYSYILENNRRHKLISKVFARTSSKGPYSMEISDPENLRREVIKKRYINARNNLKAPELYGKFMISNSKSKSYEIRIYYPGAINVSVGDKVIVDDLILGYIDNLVIHKIRYTLDQDLQNTEIVLRKEVKQIVDF